MWNIHRGSKRTPAAFSFATTCNIGRRTGTNLETLFNAIVLDRQRSSRDKHTTMHRLNTNSSLAHSPMASNYRELRAA